MISLARNVAGLIITTMLTSIGLNAVAADPYISIVLVSKMFRGEYIADRLKPVTLSTSIADSGTIVSYIVPWNVNGALVAGTLGMAAVTYLRLRLPGLPDTRREWPHRHPRRRTPAPEG